jgi:hypothetical protein
LRVERIEVQRRKIARDRGRVALTPAGMIENRRVNAAQPQRQSEHEDRRECDDRIAP